MPDTSVLNGDARTKFDGHNAEARKHEGHKLMVLRRRHVEHPTTKGYDEVTVICEDCRVQYTAHVWRRHDG